jgi:NTE family protein
MPNQNDDLDSAAKRKGIGLALSGGGYRAMLFHVGVIIRLNELGLLHRLSRVSSVSGGSITAAVLGMNWTKFEFKPSSGKVRTARNLQSLLVSPIKRMASETIDAGSIIGGILTPGLSIGDFIASRYDKLLFKKATLESLPTDQQGPRFVINATSVQTGALVRFSRPYIADYTVGRILNPTLSLAIAVAASSAFPPVLSPVTIDVDPTKFESDPNAPLQKLPYTDTMVLSDGGVYDNLGLESVIKQNEDVLISDAGGKIAPEPSPPSNWAEHSKRVLDIVDNQVRSLRKRWLLEEFTSKRLAGAYWGIRTNIADYELTSTLPAPHDKTLALAEIPTRLKALPEIRQHQLMNWGYAVCDAALRKHTASLLPAGTNTPAVYPFPGGVG